MILIVDDDIAVRMSLQLLLKGSGFDVKTAEGPSETLSLLAIEKPEMVLMDMNFSVETSGEDGLELLLKIKEIDPNIPVILMSGWGSIELAVEGMKLGAVDFINKPWKNDHFMRSVKTAISLYGQQNNTTQRPTSRRKLDKEYSFESIIGEDDKMVDVLHTIARVSKTDASVLILGESGTGKELIAEAIHRNSHRNEAAFVKVNLGGISQSLFESEMFGHVKGAFTDAHANRVGRFERANGGSIFLDEIGDLDFSSQVKMLRVLQDRSYEVLGSSQQRNLNLRVISATNRKIDEMIGSNQFREDLLYRINLITISLPPLRERPGDIAHLTNHFVATLSATYGREALTVSDDALYWLQGLPFYGNIRELKNLIERTILMSVGTRLEVADFEAHVRMVSLNQGKRSLPEVGSISLEQMEIDMINQAMAYYRNQVSAAAKSLGLSRNALYRRLEKYKIDHET